MIFTFMHLSDAFIQSHLHCIQVTGFIFVSALAFPGNRTHDLGRVRTVMKNLEKSWNFKTAISRPGKVLEK